MYIASPISEGSYRWNVFKPRTLNVPGEISNKVKPPVYPYLGSPCGIGP